MPRFAWRRVSNRLQLGVSRVAPGAFPEVDEAFSRLNIDKFGLLDIDRRLLEAIDEKFRGGPVGLDSLASAISEDPDTVSVVIEPYLVQLNFIARTAQGRVITELGRRYLKSYETVSGGVEDVLF
jgi:Holliday junction resolvasome RuvABC ATP-dependent DNA helicase subunit